MTNAQQSHIKKTSAYIQKKFESDPTGHDWWHIYRVWTTSQYIASTEKDADIYVVELASLLHEIGDYKLTTDSSQTMEQLVSKWLTSLGIDTQTIKDVVTVIDNVSFSKNYGKKRVLPIEAKIVQDADRLDAIGAIGIARTFAYGGSKGRLLYDPNIKPTIYTSTKQRQTSTTPSINHFYEKLLLLKDLMHTKTAQKIAQKRHTLMLGYLDNFYEEWNIADKD